MWRKRQQWTETNTEVVAKRESYFWTRTLTGCCSRVWFGQSWSSGTSWGWSLGRSVPLLPAGRCPDCGRWWFCVTQGDVLHPPLPFPEKIKQRHAKVVARAQTKTLQRAILDTSAAFSLHWLCIHVLIMKYILHTHTHKYTVNWKKYLNNYWKQTAY